MSTQTLGDFGVICKEIYVFYRHFADFLMTFLKILKNSLVCFSFFFQKHPHRVKKSLRNVYSVVFTERIWKDLVVFVSLKFSKITSPGTT